MLVANIVVSPTYHHHIRADRLDNTSIYHLEVMENSRTRYCWRMCDYFVFPQEGPNRDPSSSAIFAFRYLRATPSSATVAVSRNDYVIWASECVKSYPHYYTVKPHRLITSYWCLACSDRLFSPDFWQGKE